MALASNIFLVMKNLKYVYMYVYGVPRDAWEKGKY